MTRSPHRPRRSVLYMPGANARALHKARSLPADGLILDLEDAVAPDAKPRAREQVRAAVAARAYGRREVIVRINAPGTPWGHDDITAATDARPDAILLPKAGTSEDITAASILVCANTTAPPDLWAMMETPTAIINAPAIAAALREHSPAGAMVMGFNDLALEVRADICDNPTLQHAAAACLMAARAHGLALLDGVYNDITDTQGFAAACTGAKTRGLDGKTLIHPSQIASANTIFAPSPEEIASARAILDAFARPENADAGVIAVEGRMVERLHAGIAEHTIALADAIASMNAPT